MPADPATIAFYEERAPVYTASGAQGQSRHLQGFLDELEPGARILELGCGGGRDAQYMAERGYDLVTTDGTAAMVKKARERTGLPVQQLRFEELEAESEFDAVWAHACLLHVARADLADILARIHLALRPGGWHYANFKLGDGEGRDLLGRLHNFPSPSWLEDIYRSVGFTIQASEIYPGKGADGTQRDWMALTVRKTSDAA